MTTLDELMAAGIPDDGKPRRLRLTLTAIAIATVAFAAAGSIAIAQSGFAQLVAHTIPGQPQPALCRHT
ncbi:MAG TPA: hypothetical protein VFC19_02570 [Candidatus Limnocylindrales bacterium]|nr:hypothetical protein [Candidatus Limnocylindrales bacterium]